MSDAEQHKDVCPLENIECKFHSIGCVELVACEYIEQNDEKKLQYHNVTLKWCSSANHTIKLKLVSYCAEQIPTEKLDAIEIELNNTQLQLDILFEIWITDKSMAVTKATGDVAPLILKLAKFSSSDTMTRQSSLSTKQIGPISCRSVPLLSHKMGYKMFLPQVSLIILLYLT